MGSDDEFYQLITSDFNPTPQTEKKSVGRKRAIASQDQQDALGSESDEENMLEPTLDIKEEIASSGEDENESKATDASFNSDEELIFKSSDDDEEQTDQAGTKRRREIKTGDSDRSDTEAEDEKEIASGKPSKMSKRENAPTGIKTNVPDGQSGRIRRWKLRNISGEDHISQAQTRAEKTLMSLVFGGKSEIVSQLTQDAKKGKKVRKSKTKQKKKAGSDDEPEQAKRAAVWHDSDDDDEGDAANVKPNKHTREQGPLTYERRRKHFEQIVGNPKWADLDRVREPSDSEDEMMRTVGHVVKGKASAILPKGMIELKKLQNLNRETKLEGEITSINFHPTSMVALLSGKSGMVSIVAVDGVRNEKLHTIGLQKFRIVCTRLSPDGNEAVFGSYRKFFHVYNLLSGESHTLKIPERETWCMRNFRISACGKYLATAGHSGEVHVLSAKGKELLWTIQLRYACQSLAFTPDSRYLLCHSNDTEVSVYSIEKRRIVNVFADEGCVNGSAIAICPNGQFVAMGSRQGIVNIYSLNVVLEQKYPVPLKTIDNLTTYIDSLTFNATSELLAIASSNIANAVRLVHVKSGTVFRNFPVLTTNLGFVTTVEFSPSGGYLALGNKNSVVSLFRVKHYQNY